MSITTKKDISRAVRELGIKKGDMVLVHSSFKSLGEVEGGAETVISGFLDVIGEEGTLVFPTFTQKDFANAYKTWHIDKESDTGYLTNYFRKRKGSLRSNQATHSVAACGKLAYELTKTHGESGKRFGSMGDTPFSSDSPWEKMYQHNTKVVMLGVSALYTTFFHYAEYCYIEECLNTLKGKAEYEEMKSLLADFGKKGTWPHLDGVILASRLESEGKVNKSFCGDALLTEFSSRDFVDLALNSLRNYDSGVLRISASGYWDVNDWIQWAEKFRKITNNTFK